MQQLCPDVVGVMAMQDDTLKVIDEQLAVVDKKLERLEERFVFEEITRKCSRNSKPSSWMKEPK